MNFENESSKEEDSDKIQSSGESLILSQETFSHVYEELKDVEMSEIAKTVINEVNTVMTIGKSEQSESVMPDSTIKTEVDTFGTAENEASSLLQNAQFILPHSSQAEEMDNRSSLPGTQYWPGAYGFSVSFGAQENVTKKIPWIFSFEKNKLYIEKDASCPINFSTVCTLPEGTVIRATALFSTPQHSTHLVHRCYTHSFDEERKGLPEALHLIRCECDTAAYEVNSYSKRLSVVVPFDDPPAGQCFSTYIYKFVCFGSCNGGPNRRPLMVVFTLENENQVLGRQSFDLKICACPSRDKKNEEDQSPCQKRSNTPLRRKELASINNLSETLSALSTKEFPPSKKSKVAPSKDGCYYIVEEDKKMYKFLKHMKHFYEMCEMMKKSPPAITSELFKIYINTKNKKEDSD